MFDTGSNPMKPVLFTILLLCLHVVAAGIVHAQGFAVSVPVTDTTIAEGDILCSYPRGLTPCTSPYDSAIYGVITQNPSVFLEDTELENVHVVLTSGQAAVNVSTANGPISNGDIITTSERPGIGQKATRNGYALGTALEDYTAASPEDVGTIAVTLNIHPASGLSGPLTNLLEFMQEGLPASLTEPLEALRYTMASAMVLIFVTLGIVYFGRSSKAAIDAVGRNPLAHFAIRLTMLGTVIFTIVIVLAGLGLAYLLLTL